MYCFFGEEVCMWDFLFSLENRSCKLEVSMYFLEFVFYVVCIVVFDKYIEFIYDCLYL